MELRCGLSLSDEVFFPQTQPLNFISSSAGKQETGMKKEGHLSGSGTKTTLLTCQVRLRNKTGAYSNFQNKLISGLHELHGEVLK